jgi:hypothetical protein
LFGIDYTGAGYFKLKHLLLGRQGQDALELVKTL